MGRVGGNSQKERPIRRKGLKVAFILAGDRSLKNWSRSMRSKIFELKCADVTEPVQVKATVRTCVEIE